MGFKKNYTPWNKGKKCPKISRQEIFAKYGWKLLFLDETDNNIDRIKIKFRGEYY